MTNEFKKCEYYTTPCDGDLVWCEHPRNKSRNEGNCTTKDCPLIENTPEEYQGYMGNMDEVAPRLK